jgi:hypothetical protein
MKITKIETNYLFYIIIRILLVNCTENLISFKEIC